MEYWCIDLFHLQISAQDIHCSYVQWQVIVNTVSRSASKSQRPQMSPKDTIRIGLLVGQTVQSCDETGIQFMACDYTFCNKCHMLEGHRVASVWNSTVHWLPRHCMSQVYLFSWLSHWYSLSMNLRPVTTSQHIILVVNKVIKLNHPIQRCEFERGSVIWMSMQSHIFYFLGFSSIPKNYCSSSIIIMYTWKYSRYQQFDLQWKQDL